jgi:hypothetical protein
MALLGPAALAMWWDMAPEAREEFQHWHSHEHFPERLGIPGFRRGTRWASADGGTGFFVMYELAAYETLSSPEYAARLNAPTPWSTKMMPHHSNMVRSQCRVLESRGGGVARHALTVRLAPAAGREEPLRASLHALIDTEVANPGIVGAHLLQHATPPIAPTTEQRIRGNADRAADWVFVACGYELAALERLAQNSLDAASLAALGATDGQVSGLYTVAYSAVPGDIG